MKKSIFFILAFILFATSSIFSQDDKELESVFTLNAEFRPRTELYLGYKTLALDNQNEAIITNQRTRINFKYESQKMTTKLVLQDVRIWGNQKQLVANEDFAMSVHEAWGEMFFTKNLSLKAGRMEIIYDDHRIFGSVGWAPQARSHDAAIFKYTTEKMHVHFGGALYNENITNNFYDGANAYKAFQFVHFNYSSDPISLSLLFLNNGKPENEFGLTYNDFFTGVGTRTGQGIAYSQTIGGRFEFKKDALFFGLSGYYQMGKKSADWATALDSIPDTFTIADNTTYKTAAGQGKTIGAYEFNVELSYKINNLSIGAGGEVLSGNSFSMDSNTGLISDNNADENAFSPFYGTNHKFNGWMDYFYVGNHANNVGLVDIYGKFIYKKDKFFMKFIPHYFMTSGKGIYSSMNVDNTTGVTTYTENDYEGSLGTELDFWGGYTVGKGVKIQFGYSVLLPDDNMKALKLGSFDVQTSNIKNWAWVMLSFNPTLLIHKTFKTD